MLLMRGDVMKRAGPKTEVGRSRTAGECIRAEQQVEGWRMRAVEMGGGRSSANIDMVLLRYEIPGTGPRTVTRRPGHGDKREIANAISDAYTVTTRT